MNPGRSGGFYYHFLGMLLSQKVVVRALIPAFLLILATLGDRNIDAQDP